MPNTNGLNSSRDVCATGDVNSNYFIRKNQPLSITSPLIINSSDASKSATVAVANSGNVSITNDNASATDGSITLACAQSAISSVYIVNKPSSKVAAGIVINNLAGDDYNASAQYYCDTDGAALVASSTGIVRLGNSSSATPVVEVVGSAGTGQVYDSVYKPVNKVITLQATTSGDIALSLNPYVLEAGTYRLELYTEGTIVPAVGTRLRMAVLPTVAPIAVVDYSQASINDVAADGTIGFSLNSGSFTVEAGNYDITVQSSGANWTATNWGMQLVKLA